IQLAQIWFIPGCDKIHCARHKVSCRTLFTVMVYQWVSMASHVFETSSAIPLTDIPPTQSHLWHGVCFSPSVNVNEQHVGEAPCRPLLGYLAPFRDEETQSGTEQEEGA